MAKRMSIAAGKGGVGKTTLALNEAFSLAQRGWRVLLVDGDPIGGIGKSLAGEARRHVGLFDALRGEATLEEAIIHTKVHGFSILPAGSHQSFAQANRAVIEFSNPLHWDGFLSEVDESYDLVLFDTPAGLTGLTYAMLWHSDSVLLPLQAEPLAWEGLSESLEAIGELREEGRPLTVAGVILSMVDPGNPFSLELLLKSYTEFPTEALMETTIFRDSVFAEAQAKGTPVGLLRKPAPIAASVFDCLAAELEPRIGLVRNQDAHATFLFD